MKQNGKVVNRNNGTLTANRSSNSVKWNQTEEPNQDKDFQTGFEERQFQSVYKKHLKQHKQL